MNRGLIVELRINQGSRLLIWNFLMVAFTIVLVMALNGCFKSSSKPINGTETHFLKKCSNRCDDGLQCVSGLCTRECEPDSDSCKELTAAAICTSKGVSGDDVAICDVPCESTSGCRKVDEQLVCVDQFCRGPQLEPNEQPKNDGGDEIIESGISENDGGDEIIESGISDHDTIVDQNTGLTWLTESPGKRNWNDASQYCETLNAGDKTKWRMPEIEELDQIYPYAKALIVNMNTDRYSDASYWSATYAGYVACEAEATNNYFVRHFDRDVSYDEYCDYASHHFTCVHD